MADRQPLLEPEQSSATANQNSSEITNATSLGLQDQQSDALLKAQGHDAEIERSFSPLAAVALGFSAKKWCLLGSITNSWVGYLSCFGQNLAYAGPNSVVFGLFAAVVIQWIISLGLFEIASCFPSSGGQYHFVFILAPKAYKRFAAFCVGWINILGWSVALSSGISVVVASVSGLIAFWDPSFQATQVQFYILYVVVAITTVCPLFLVPRAIPKLLQASLVFSIVGLLTILGIVLFFRQQTRPTSFLLNTNGSSGWGKTSAWMLGLSNSMYAFSSTDAAIHIAEEMTHPGKRLPQVINMTLAIGIATSFPLILICMLSVIDTEAIIQSTLPYGEMFLQITGSRPLTTFIMVWITLVLFSALVGQWVTCGRLAWAFARDGGLPFSSSFEKIDERFAFPVRATILCLVFSCCYGLLYFVSTTAFNSIITSAVLFSNTSYCIPQAIVAWRGRKSVLPDHTYDLSWFGYICNYMSPILILVLSVLICFPPQLPLTTENINYTPAVVVGFGFAILAGWFVIGEKFKGPNIDWEILKNVKVT